MRDGMRLRHVMAKSAWTCALITLIDNVDIMVLILGVIDAPSCNPAAIYTCRAVERELVGLKSTAL